MGMEKTVGFLRGKMESAPGLALEGHLNGGRNTLVNAEPAFDLAADLLQWRQRRQDLAHQPGRVVHQAKKEMLGSDLGGTQLTQFVTGKEHRAARRLVIAFEHIGYLMAMRFLLMASLVTAMAQGTAIAQPLTAEQDLQRTMQLLKISGFPPGAVASSPETYNEATANPYPNLPDPLTFKNGKKVTTAALWRARREEIVEDFEREVYGRRPKSTPKVTWHVLNTIDGRDGERATVTKHLLGRVDNSAYPAISVNIQAALTLPANARGPVPVIIQFGGSGGGFEIPPSFSTSSNPCAPPPGRGQTGPARGTPPSVGGSPAPTWQQQILSRGWGFVVLNVGSVQGDCAAGLQAGIIGLVNKGQPRGLDDWGGLSAWGWGASRVLDYLETDRAVDASRVGVQGHSRSGKAALLAMALDERFAIGYISSSGHGGAKLHRRKYGETVESLVTRFHYWMGGNYLKYAGRWHTLPVDSHELVALCAPRPVFISAGNGPGAVNPDGTVEINDAWVDARGSFLAALNAGPVYRLLGRQGVSATEFPPIDTPVIAGDVGFRQHTAGHTPNPTWPTFLEFAARYFTR